MKIAVLGAGSFGTTIASLMSKRNETVLWARSHDVAAEVNALHTNSAYLRDARLNVNLRATNDLAEAVSSAEVLIMGVPTSAFRDTLQTVVPHLRPWTPVVSLTKGLEQGSLLRMTQVIEELVPGHPAAALTGPNIAGEIVAGQASASVIATEDESVGTELRRVLQSGLFRVYYNHDVAGCEIGGALKNVIAIAVGMAEGLGTGDNTRAAMFTRGLAELTRVGVAMGGEAATFAGLTGLGDLMVTCMSQRSRNRHVGEQLGLGRSLPQILEGMTMVAEGVRTASTVVEIAERHGVAIPICATVNKVLEGELTAREAFDGLNPEAGHEADPA